MIDIDRSRRQTKAEQESEVERAYRTLKSWLIEARLPPGDFLSELDLATRCKTSRTPIREAFSRLAQDGRLTRIRRNDTICTQNVPGWIGHKEILSALRAHQAEAAKLVMARHIDLSRDKMLRLFGA